MTHDPLPAALYLDGQMGLVDDMLHYFDRTSMAYSLEVRVPFLDHHLVEYCATIPAGYKVRRFDTKHVLKRAVRGLVPDRIIDKPKIGFFHSTVDAWLLAQTRGAVSDFLLGPNPRYAEILDRRCVEQLVRRHVAGDAEGNPRLLLAILMLEVWLSSYLPRARAPTRRRAPSSRSHDPRVRGRHAGARRGDEPRPARVVARRAEDSPAGWMIVDNGSSDGTLEIAQRLAAEHDWVHVLSVPSDGVDRGAPIVRALHAGIAALPEQPDVLVSVDADISMGPDYFERLLARFDADPSLGIASGSAFELRRGSGSSAT